jgi:hypothetical protein
VTAMRTPPLRSTVLPLIIAAFSGCASSASVEAPGGTPLVSGPVESVTSHATGTGLLVRAGPGSREPCGILAVADARTRYLRRTGAGSLQEASLADVSVGDTVEVYVEGPVAESCPVQGTASAVVLVSGLAP